jgi:hypothetical protein
VVFAFLAFLSLPMALPAQQTSGVNGVITDKTGGTISEVQVALDNSLLGIHLQTTTNDLGFFQFLHLDPGAGYQLTFTKGGFRKVVLSDISLGVASVATYNTRLELGSVTQSIEVTSAGESTLNTTDATVGNVIDSKSVQELPIQFRLNPANLLTLQAGVNDAGSITGARSDQGNLTLDGLDVNDQATGQAFTVTIPVSIDSLQEVRTVTAGETSDYGRSSGGGIDMVTKSGTNDWHGNAREYNRNTLFEANDWFNNKDGVARAPLIRNQFGGSVGGPIKKDKLFFFFDYEGLRTAASESIERSVPTASFAAGNLSYINSGTGCDGTARLNTNPSCISTLTPAQVTALDPAGIGPDQALLNVIASRPYPAPNDPSGGDGINSEGFRFTAPAHTTENLYTTRVDYTLNSKNKLFLRGSVAREGVDDDFNTDIVQFPGDPAPDMRDRFNEYAFSVGWTWTQSSTLVNDLSAGLVRTILSFPAMEAPTYPNQFIFGGPLSSPYLGSSSQSRNVPVPEFRDSLIWTKGKHTLEFGEDIKLIRQISALKNDFNFISIGLGGYNGSLDAPGEPLRPSDLNSDPSAISNWDNAFPFLLGRFADVTSNFNYSKTGTPFPNGTGKNRDYNYNEFEFYAQDAWKARSDLTLTFGLRWDYHSVPYEVNGYQSVPSVGENAFLGIRLYDAMNGISGATAVPFQSYSLGGSANNAEGYYNPDHKDFGPRIAVAYNPSARDGLLGSIFGDRRTTIRLGGALLYDRIAGGASFGLDQNTFLFDNQINYQLGVPRDPVSALLNDPRFTGYNSLPAGLLPQSPNITAPTTPSVVNGVPIGTSVYGGFPAFFQFDRDAKTPYAIVMNFGFQRELPGNFLLEANYVGRLGRRLLAVGDAATITNFKDPASGQFLRDAFGQLEKQVQNGQPITAQPWFENQLGGTAFCEFIVGTNCTQILVNYLGQYVSKGDLSDTVAGLAEFGLLNYNVGLPAQVAANGYIGNYASSNYNGLLVTLRKRISKGLQFDFNYTFSHSIDNVSEITNNYVTYTGTGAGLVCDLTDPRACRASSDFDARHIISANYVYDLPFGRNREYLSNASRGVDYLLGGWSWSGIVTWRTGYPFSVHTYAFPTAYTLDSPALVVSRAGLGGGIHTENGNLQFFKDSTAALNSLSFPEGGMIGTRNAMTGPGFWNIDMGISKSFTLPWSERQKLVLRGDSFNTFNHPSFSPPNSTLSNLSSFGLITSTASTPRVLQVSLRFQF